MTIDHMQLINKEKTSLSDDSTVASSIAEITINNTLLKIKPDELGVRKSGKSIRFAEENDYYEVDHIEDMDKEEVENTWYTKRELEMISDACALTVHLMSKVRRFKESKEHCPRGLEDRTPMGIQKRQANSKAAIKAVRDELHRQQVEGIVDDKRLSQVYKQATSQCQQVALQRGLEDAQSVANPSCKAETIQKKLPRWRSLLGRQKRVQKSHVCASAA